MSSHDPALHAARVRHRQEKVYLRFRRTKLSFSHNAFWRACNFQRTTIQLFSLITILCPLELALWLPDWKNSEFDFYPIGFYLLPIILIPLRICIADHFFSRRSPFQRAPSKSIALLRLFVLALPGGTLAALTWFELDRKVFKSTEATTCLKIDQAQIIKHSVTRHRFKQLYSSTAFSIVMATDCFYPALAGFWLIKTDVLGTYRSQVILTSCLLTHLLACILASCHSRLILQQRRIKGWSAWVAPALLLTPLPGPLLALRLVSAEESRRGSLVSKFFDRPKSGETSLWPALEAALQLRAPGESWRARWRRPEPEKTEFHSLTGSHILSFFRLKLMTLPLDVPLFFVGWMQLNSRFLSLDLLLLAVFCLSLLLMAGGLLTQLWRFATRKLRLPFETAFLARYPYGRYMLLTGTASLLGFIELALLWEKGESRENYIEMFIGLGALLALFTLTAWPQSEPRIRSRSPIAPQVLWVLLSLSVAGLAFMMRKDESLLHRFLLILSVLIVLSPLWNFILFFTLRGWLLRPFSLKHVFDRRLLLRFRAVLLFMVLSAALPLGGLAVPFWIYARHRLWPRYEPLLGSR